jgi:hypothetical protein
MLSQAPQDEAPFSGIKIFLHVRTTNDMADKTKHDAKKAIKKLGGSLTVNLDDAKFVVFHNGSEALLQNALAKGKPVLTPQFLLDCKKANKMLGFQRDHLVSHHESIDTDLVCRDANDETSRKRQRDADSSRPYLLDNDDEPAVASAASSPRVQSPPPNTQALSDALDNIVCLPNAKVAANSPSEMNQSILRSESAKQSEKQIKNTGQAVQSEALRAMRIKPERITITGPEEEKGFLRDIIVGFGAEFELKVFGRVKKPTHYIVLSDAITPKILLARITGAPMLTREWVTDSLVFGGFVEPLPRHYHPLFVEPTRSLSESGGASPPKSKVARDLERHRLELSGVAARRGSFYAHLLASKTFYLLGTSENPTNEVYAELLRLMGASIARTLQTDAEVTAVIEVDGGLARNTMLSQSQRDQLRTRTIVSTAWIVETASTGTAAPFEPFSVLPDAAPQSLKALLGGLTPLAKTKQGPSTAAKVQLR